MDKAELSLENASPTDIPPLEHNLMSLQEFNPDKVIKLQKDSIFANTYYNIHIAVKMIATSWTSWASYIKRLSILTVHFQPW